MTEKMLQNHAESSQPASRQPAIAPKLPTALPDEPWHTVQCAPHPPPAVISCPRIPWSRRGAGVPPRTPASVVRVRTVAQLIWRYCKMFFTESAARGLIDVIDVIDHAWRPSLGTSRTQRHLLHLKNSCFHPAGRPATGRARRPVPTCSPFGAGHPPRPLLETRRRAAGDQWAERVSQAGAARLAL